MSSGTTTVDNRVVNMQFNNAQFEAGVKQTITSLDELKKSLDINTNATHLANVQRQFDSFSVRNMEENLQALADRFSNLGIVGMTVIQNLTNSLTNFVKNKALTAYNQILTGGWNRASSIATARFTLEGLFANEVDGAEKVTEAMNSAMDSVTGTAYTMASAASAASQLAASGVDTGEDMYNTLRSIAGVASMTGDSFDNIANIFTAVAGNGRLMGMQLTQLSMHGLNAAATIAKYLNTTEAEVREMTSKGEIDFKTFSAAMQDAFGEQAGKANTTFSGTMDNIKAQLSKIGEIFGTGIIENKSVIKFLNDVRIKLGGIKDIIGNRLKDSFNNMMKALSKIGSLMLKVSDTTGFKNFIDIVGSAMDKITTFSNTFLDLSNTAKKFGIISDTITSVSERQANIATKIFEGSEAWGKSATELKKSLGVDYKSVQAYLSELEKSGGDASKVSIRVKGHITNSAYESAKAIGKITESAETATESFNPLQIMIDSITKAGEGMSIIWSSVKKGVQAIGEALSNIYSFTDLTKDISHLGDLFTSLTKVFELTDERTKKLKSGFKGLFSILNMLKRVYIGIADVMVKTFGPIASEVLDVILSMWEYVGLLIVRLDKWEEKNKILASTFETVSKFINKVYDGIKELLTKVSQLESFQKLKGMIKETAEELGDNMAPALKWILSVLNSIIDTTDGGSFIDKIVNVIDKGLKILIKAFELARKGAKALFDFLFTPQESAEDGAMGTAIDSADQANTLFDKIKALLDKAKSSVKSVRDIVEFVLDIFVMFTKKMVDVVNDIDIIKVFLATTLFSANLFIHNLTSTVKKGKNLINRITNIFNRGVNVSAVISSITKLIIAITVALVVLSSLDQDKLKSTVIILGSIIAVIVAFTVALTLIANKIKNFKETSSVLAGMTAIMTSFSTAIFIMALAMKELSEIAWGDWTQWGKTILAMVSVITMLTAAMLVINKFGGGTAESVKIISLALAVYVLTSSLALLAKLDLTGIYKKLLVLFGAIVMIQLLAKAASNVPVLRTFGLLVLIGEVVILEIALWSIVKYGVGLDDIKANIDKFIIIIATLFAMVFILNRISDTKFNAGKAQAIRSLVNSLLSIAASVKILGSMSMEQVAQGVFAIILILRTLLNGMQQIEGAKFDEKTFKHTIKLIGKFIRSIILLALLAALLGSLPFGSAFVGVAVIASMIKVLSYAIKTLSDVKGTKYKNLKQITKMIRSFAVAMVLISASLAILVLITGLKTMTLAVAAASIIAIILTITEGIAKMNKSIGGGIKAGLLAELAVFISGIVLIIVALTVMMALTSNPYKLIIAGIVIVGMIAVLVGTIQYFNKKISTSINALRGLVGLTMMVFVVIAIAESVAILSRVVDTVKPESVLYSVIAIGSILAVMGIFIQQLSSANNINPSVLTAFNSMIIGVAAIAISLKLLLIGGLDTGQLMVAALSIAAVIITIAGAMAIMSTIAVNPVAVAMLIAMIGLIVALALTLEPISNGIKSLTASLLGLLTVDIIQLTIKMAAFMAVGLLLAPVLILLGIGAGLLGATLLILGAGFSFAGVGFNIFSKSLLTLNKTLKTISLMTIIGTLAAFVGIGLLLTPILIALGAGAVVLGSGLLLVGAGVIVAGAGAVLLGTGFMMIATAISLVAEAMSKIVKELPDFADNLSTAIVSIANSIADTVGGTIAAIVSAVVQAGVALFDGLGDISDSLFDFIGDVFVDLSELVTKGGKAIFKSIRKLFPELMETIFTLVEQLAKWAPEIGRELGILIIKILYAIAKVIYERSDMIADTIILVVKGIFKALYILVGKLGDLVIAAIKKSVDDWKEIWLGFKAWLSDEEGPAEEEYQKFIEQREEQKTLTDEDIKEAEEAMDAEMDFSEIDKKYSQAGDSNVSSYIESFKSKASSTDLSDTVSGMFHTEDTGKEVVSQGDQAAEAFLKQVTKRIETSELPPDMLRGYLANGWKKINLTDETGHVVEYIEKQFTEQMDAAEVATDGLIDVETLYKDVDQIKKDLKTQGIYAGQNYIRGVNQGLDDKVLLKRMKELSYGAGETVDEEFRKGAKEESPSKAGKEAGQFYFKGVNLGLLSLFSLPSDTARAAAENMVDVFGATLAAIYNNVDSIEGLSPTITPVVDTSSLENAGILLRDVLPIDNLKIGDIASSTSVSFNEASQQNLAMQVQALSEQVKKLAETDYSTMLEGVNFNIDASTNVDGKPLRQSAATYTIDQIDEAQKGLTLAMGGRV